MANLKVTHDLTMKIINLILLNFIPSSATDMIGVCWSVLFLAVLSTELKEDKCINTSGSTKCDNITDGCTSQECKNDATCIKTASTENICVCSPGYTGKKCDDRINECSKQTPCKNSAKCLKTEGSYFCKCMQGCTDYNGSTSILGIHITPCWDLDPCRDEANQYNCTCAANYTEGDAGCVCFNTSAYNYTVLHDKGVQIQDGQTRLQFEVRACSDAHVLLMESCTDEDNGLFEIVIGGWSNTMSAIRIANQHHSHNVTVNHTVEPLNCSEMNSFWIDWKDNVIRVGNGSDVGYNRFMDLNCSGNMTIKYLAISTWNHTGYWMFNASTCTVTEKTTIQAGATSITNVQTAAQTTGNTVTSLTEDTTTKTGATGITDGQTAAQTTGNTVTSVTSTASSRNTHDIVPSTPTVETTAKIAANHSTCTCPCYLCVIQTEIEREMQLKTAIELIRKELKIEKKNLSSMIRKKTSARDERVSAKTIGFTLGVCVLTTVFGSIIMWDLVRLGQFIWKKFQ